MENLTKSLTLTKKAMALNLETSRERDHIMHQMNSLRLENTKLAEYEQELAAENYELMKRLGIFEEELNAANKETRKIEQTKEDIACKVDELQVKLLEKGVETENILREKNDLQVQVRSLTQSISLLEAITDNQREDIVKDRELFDSLENNNKQLQNYKQAFLDKRVECDKFEMKINSLETELRNRKAEAENENSFTLTLRKEIRDLKDKVAEYETLKKEYMNNLGVSKLGLSSLNFSKMFQHDANGGMTVPVSKPVSQMVSNRESIVKNAVKTDIPESTVFAFTDKIPRKQEAPQVNFFGVDESVVNFGNKFARDSEVNPYMNRESIQRLTVGSSLRVSNSRISNLLMAIGNYANGTNFDIKQDYMNMSVDDKAVAELARLGDEIESHKCYSDTVFLFNKAFKKSRFIVVVTKYAISFFNLRKNKLMKLYLLKSLKGITISATNYTLCVFHFENQADLLLESYRRLEVISYINHMFKVTELPKFDLTVRKRFVLKSDVKKSAPERIEVSDPNLKINLSFLQDAVRNSRKSGYLTKVTKHWYGVAPTEYFCMLSNIGLVCFKKYGVRVCLT